MHSTGTPIDVHCFKGTLLCEVHERVEELMDATTMAS